MDFSQPSGEIVTNKTEAEQKRLTEIRNQVTLLEGETVRLRDLIQSEKYEIGELVKQKAELTEIIPQLQAQRDTIGDTIASLTESLYSLEEEKEKANKVLQSALSETENAKNKAMDILQGLDVERERLEIAKANFVEEQEAFELESKMLNEKLAQLRKIVL